MAILGLNSPPVRTLEQRRFGAWTYSALMPGRHTASAIGAGWILAAGVIGVMANVTSVGAAVLLVVFGLVPPLIMVAFVAAYGAAD